MARLLTIVTATYNSASCLPDLAESLLAQTDREFDWVVADGGSTDGTLEYLEGLRELTPAVITGPDYGIYDAINKAVRNVETDYYLVVGSDDQLMPNAVENYHSMLGDRPDIATANVLRNDMVHRARAGVATTDTNPWHHVSCHSIGCVFKKELHDKHGYYSKRFPIAADQQFIIKAVQGAGTIKVGDFIAGRFGDNGVSSSDVLGHISETFRIQYEHSERRNLALATYIFRLIKNRVLGKF